MRLASVEAVARALNDGGVPFIVVGGLAVVAHGYGRQTADVDFVIRLDPAAVHAMFHALDSLGYRPRVPVTAMGFADPEQRDRWISEKGMQVLNFHSDAHRDTPVDVFVSEPFDFGTEYQQALVQEIAPGVPMRIVKLETLLRMKADVGRPQDIADVAELRRIHEGA
jgi:predicted nucleotidyltransferase